MEKLLFNNEFFENVFGNELFKNAFGRTSIFDNIEYFEDFEEFKHQESGYYYFDKEKNEHVITIEASGFSKDDIEISVEEKGLKITGDLKDEKLKERIGEKTLSYFVNLKNIGAKDAEASLDKGVLEIRCKRKEPKKSSKIIIK